MAEKDKHLQSSETSKQLLYSEIFDGKFCHFAKLLIRATRVQNRLLLVWLILLTDHFKLTNMYPYDMCR